MAGIERRYKALVSALLIQAIEDYLRGPMAGRDYETAHSYIFDQNQGPLNFELMCSYMGVDPERARLAVKRQFKEKFPGYLDCIRKFEAALGYRIRPERMHGALAILKKKEARALILCFGLKSGHPMSLRKVANIMEISHEGVRQIERKALNKLQDVRPKNIMSAPGLKFQCFIREGNNEA